MRTMHRVNGLMFQDLLRYEKKAREMTEQKTELAQGTDVQAARDHIAGLIADLQGEHEVMAGPFDPAAWKLDVPVVHLQALLGCRIPAETDCDCPADESKACDLLRKQVGLLREREKKLLAEKIQDKKDLYDYCVRAEQAEALVESARAHAIEECARIASCYSPSPWDAERMRTGIVGAIRALSDTSTVRGSDE